MNAKNEPILPIHLNQVFTGHGIGERETILDLGVTSYIIIA